MNFCMVLYVFVWVGECVNPTVRNFFIGYNKKQFSGLDENKISATLHNVHSQIQLNMNIYIFSVRHIWSINERGVAISTDVLHDGPPACDALHLREFSRVRRHCRRSTVRCATDKIRRSGKPKGTKIFY